MEESDLIKAAMAFFYGHYHGKFLLGGSTNQNVTSKNGGIGFENYLTNNSGIIALNQCIVYSLNIYVITFIVGVICSIELFVHFKGFTMSTSSHGLKKKIYQKMPVTMQVMKDCSQVSICSVNLVECVKKVKL